MINRKVNSDVCMLFHHDTFYRAYFLKRIYCLILGSGYFAGPGKIAPRGYFAGPSKIRLNSM